jgi:hypothetical protein
MSKLKALKDYHGMPTLFVTILPDDTHDLKKMSLQQANNDDFPTIPGNFINALQNNNSAYNGIPIFSNNLRELLACGPVAAAVC